MSTLYRSSCSDSLSPEALERWRQVELWLADRGLTPRELEPGQGPWNDPEWQLVADPTGGTAAQQRLPFLVDSLPTMDLPEQRRAWWSMSDNCQILNALIDTGLCRPMHGHPLTLAGRDAEAQKGRFAQWFDAVRKGAPFPTSALPKQIPLRRSLPPAFALLGGNLTALERLGETPWRPHPKGRVLLVESFSCPADNAPHRVAALTDDPWWEGIGGLILGRFTHADRDDPAWLDRCLSLLPPDLPVARLPQVGHGADGWTVPLGELISLPL